MNEAVPNAAAALSQTAPAPLRRALVTGGSGDIGGAICRALAADGLFVHVHANSAIERAETLAHELRSHGGHAQAVARGLERGDPGPPPARQALD